jgi:hypothetical protein
VSFTQTNFPFPGIGRCLPIEGRCRIPRNRQPPASLVPSRDGLPGVRSQVVCACMCGRACNPWEFIAQLGAAFHLA